MLFSARQVDVTYEAYFRPLAIDVATQPGQVLFAIYRSIAPRYPISASDMKVTSGTTVGDIRASISLFNGNGVLLVDAEKFTATFKNPLAPGDRKTVEECIGLAREAITNALPTSAVNNESVAVHGFLSLLEEPKDAASFLASLTGGMLFASHNAAESDTKTYFGLKIEKENTNEGWQAVFDLSRSYSFPHELFFACRATFNANSAIASLDEKANHLEKLTYEYFESVGLRPSNV